jgi:hypothetical protein
VNIDRTIEGNLDTLDVAILDEIRDHLRQPGVVARHEGRLTILQPCFSCTIHLRTKDYDREAFPSVVPPLVVPERGSVRMGGELLKWQAVKESERKLREGEWWLRYFLEVL